MPAMSKIATAAAGAAALTAASAFVAPTAAPARTAQGSALRGERRSSSVSSLGLSGLSLGAVGLAAVLAPPSSKPASKSVAVKAYDASGEIGACDPLLFWDPIGYCTEGCTKEDFDRRRAVELKHGRLCMVATIGMVWPDIFGKFDGYLSPSQNLKFSDVPSGIAAVSKVPLEGWLQILLVAGLIETQLFKDQSFGGFAYGKYGAEPGNFGTGYWGRKIQDPAERRLKLTTELNNGRLAMIAMAGMLIQNGLTGQSPIEQLQAGHYSPFNDGQGFFAFDPSQELGACPPLGYWDPFGMMAFQDEEKFRRNRELELKHGRICMAATIGMIVPDLFGRFGGYLSPSAGLKFSDIPCTIEAIYKVPTFGWLQIFALAGAIEAKNQAFPENYGYPPFWGRINTLEPEEKQKKLLAEINNGRLAMVAMAAIVAQNGATGQSLVEQFTTGNLNPFVGGYAQREASDRVALRAEFGSGAGKSTALPWDPIPEGLTNDIFNQTYVGDVGFDPAGFAKNQRLLPWYREAELAHGRVCMLAVLGYTVQTAGAKFEPFITRYPTDSADPLKAATQVPIIGWLQIIVVIALSELWRYENVISKYDQGVQPGDLGWNPTAPVGSPRPKWFGPTFTAAYQPEEWNNMKLREIKHCRLAMVGFFFMVLRNASTGEGPSLLPNLAAAEFQSSVGDFIPRDICTIAVLIDGENISPSSLGPLMQAARSAGEIQYSRIYLNEHKASLFNDRLSEQGIEAVVVPQLSSGLKDPSDIMLALDAVEECLKGTASAIAVASEDVDFALVLRKVRELGRRSFAVTPLRAPSRSQELLRSAADGLLFFGDHPAISKVAEHLDTSRLDSDVEFSEVSLIPQALNEDRRRKMEQLEQLLQELGYLPKPPQQGVMVAALAKFFHANQLGRLTVRPLHEGLTQAFSALERPPAGGWAPDPKNLVFLKHRGEAGRGPAVTDTPREARKEGPFLTSISDSLVERVLLRFGYLQAGEESREQVTEAIQLFCDRNQKELQKYGLQAAQQQLPDARESLHQIFTEPNRLQVWRRAADDVKVRSRLKDVGEIRHAGAPRPQLLEAMRRLLRLRAPREELPRIYAAHVARCLQHLTRALAVGLSSRLGGDPMRMATDAMDASACSSMPCRFSDFAQPTHANAEHGTCGMMRCDERAHRRCGAHPRGVAVKEVTGSHRDGNDGTLPQQPCWASALMGALLWFANLRGIYSLDWTRVPWVMVLLTALSSALFNFLIKFGLSRETPVTTSLGTQIGIPLNFLLDLFVVHSHFRWPQAVGVLTMLLSFSVWHHSEAREAEGQKPGGHGPTARLLN
ncbi:unnamed protein product [Symbiodinium natans]|uniref:NYN domain-containing protein n=1 Tax=Symbiodinium natans TaxID=878477 RepID=A0A812I5E3_9DINO|nr:unnamed protein product [Symbiodinium natans]